MPPTPLTPPMGEGGAKVILVGYDWKTMLAPIDTSIIGKLLTSNLLGFFYKSPDPSDPLGP